MQEFQGFQHRYEGRMEENERTVAQVIGSEVRDALRGQRSHMLHEHQVLLPAGGREKEFVNSQMHSELQLFIHCKLSKILAWTGSATRANYTKLGIPGDATNSPVANWGAHDVLSKGECPKNLRKWEASRHWTEWNLKHWIQRLPRESWRLFRPTSRERSLSWRRLNTKTNVQCSQANDVSSISVQHQWASGAHDETEWVAQCRVVQRHSQVVQSGLGRNTTSPW